MSEQKQILFTFCKTYLLQSYKKSKIYKFSMKNSNIVLVQIQHCQNCHLHSWCSRHDQNKYKQHLERVRQNARNTFDNVEFRTNQPQKSFEVINQSTSRGETKYFDHQSQKIVNFPRFGSFQVYVNGTLIFSKLQSNLWPKHDRIAMLFQKMKDEMDNNNNLEKYSLQYRLKNDSDEYFRQTYKKTIQKNYRTGLARPMSQNHSEVMSLGNRSPQNIPLKLGNINFISRKLHQSQKRSQFSLLQEKHEFIKPYKPENRSVSKGLRRPMTNHVSRGKRTPAIQFNRESQNYQLASNQLKKDQNGAQKLKLRGSPNPRKRLQILRDAISKPQGMKNGNSPFNSSNGKKQSLILKTQIKKVASSTNQNHMQNQIKKIANVQKLQPKTNSPRQNIKRNNWMQSPNQSPIHNSEVNKQPERLFKKVSLKNQQRRKLSENPPTQHKNEEATTNAQKQEQKALQRSEQRLIAKLEQDESKQFSNQPIKRVEKQKQTQNSAQKAKNYQDQVEIEQKDYIFDDEEESEQVQNVQMQHNSPKQKQQIKIQQTAKPEPIQTKNSQTVLQVKKDRSQKSIKKLQVEEYQKFEQQFEEESQKKQENIQRLPSKKDVQSQKSKKSLVIEPEQILQVNSVPKTLQQPIIISKQQSQQESTKKLLPIHNQQKSIRSFQSENKSQKQAQQQEQYYNEFNDQEQASKSSPLIPPEQSYQEQIYEQEEEQRKKSTSIENGFSKRGQIEQSPLNGSDIINELSANHIQNHYDHLANQNKSSEINPWSKKDNQYPEEFQQAQPAFTIGYSSKSNVQVSQNNLQNQNTTKTKLERPQQQTYEIEKQFEEQFEEEIQNEKQPEKRPQSRDSRSHSHRKRVHSVQSLQQIKNVSQKGEKAQNKQQQAQMNGDFTKKQKIPQNLLPNNTQKQEQAQVNYEQAIETEQISHPQNDSTKKQSNIQKQPQNKVDEEQYANQEYQQQQLESVEQSHRSIPIIVSTSEGTNKIIQQQVQKQLQEMYEREQREKEKRQKILESMMGDQEENVSQEPNFQKLEAQQNQNNIPVQVQIYYKEHQKQNQTIQQRNQDLEESIKSQKVNYAISADKNQPQKQAPKQEKQEHSQSGLEQQIRIQPEQQLERKDTSFSNLIEKELSRQLNELQTKLISQEEDKQEQNHSVQSIKNPPFQQKKELIKKQTVVKEQQNGNSVQKSANIPLNQELEPQQTQIDKAESTKAVQQLKEQLKKQPKVVKQKVNELYQKVLLIETSNYAQKIQQKAQEERIQQKVPQKVEQIVQDQVHNKKQEKLQQNGQPNLTDQDAREDQKPTELQERSNFLDKTSQNELSLAPVNLLSQNQKPNVQQNVNTQHNIGKQQSIADQIPTHSSLLAVKQYIHQLQDGIKQNKAEKITQKNQKNDQQEVANKNEPKTDEAAEQLDAQVGEQNVDKQDFLKVEQTEKTIIQQTQRQGRLHFVKEQLQKLQIKVVQAGLNEQHSQPQNVQAITSIKQVQAETSVKTYNHQSAMTQKDDPKQNKNEQINSKAQVIQQTSQKQITEQVKNDQNKQQQPQLEKVQMQKSEQEKIGQTQIVQTIPVNSQILQTVSVQNQKNKAGDQQQKAEVQNEQEKVGNTDVIHSERQNIALTQQDKASPELISQIPKFQNQETLHKPEQSLNVKNLDEAAQKQVEKEQSEHLHEKSNEIQSPLSNKEKLNVSLSEFVQKTDKLEQNIQQTVQLMQNAKQLQVEPVEQVIKPEQHSVKQVQAQKQQEQTEIKRDDKTQPQQQKPEQVEDNDQAIQAQPRKIQASIKQLRQIKENQPQNLKKQQQEPSVALPQVLTIQQKQPQVDLPKQNDTKKTIDDELANLNLKVAQNNQLESQEKENQLILEKQTQSKAVEKKQAQKQPAQIEPKIQEPKSVTTIMGQNTEKIIQGEISHINERIVEKNQQQMSQQQKIEKSEHVEVLSKPAQKPDQQFKNLQKPVIEPFQNTQKIIKDKLAHINQKVASFDQKQPVQSMVNVN